MAIMVFNTAESRLNDANLSKSKTDVERGHRYPADILSESNKNRHIRILVKGVNIFNDAGALASDMVETVKKDLKGLSNIVNHLEPSDIDKQKDLSNRTNALVKCSTIYGIALALPNELSDSQSHDWEETTGIAHDAVEAAGGLVEAGANSLATTLVGKENGTKIVDAGGKVLNLALKAGNQLMSSSGFRKPLVNPGYFQDYKGTKPRAFSFSWDFVPNNSNEAKQIFNIIYNLKKFTLPTLTLAQTALLSPYIFEIQVGNNLINSMMNMNNLVCKGMDVNYTSDNTLQMFADGMPKHITLKMEFAERTLMTADLY